MIITVLHRSQRLPIDPTLCKTMAKSLVWLSYLVRLSVCASISDITGMLLTTCLECPESPATRWVPDALRAHFTFCHSTTMTGRILPVPSPHLRRFNRPTPAPLIPAQSLPNGPVIDAEALVRRRPRSPPRTPDRDKTPTNILDITSDMRGVSLTPSTSHEDAVEQTRAASAIRDTLSPARSRRGLMRTMSASTVKSDPEPSEEEEEFIFPDITRGPDVLPPVIGQLNIARPHQVLSMPPPIPTDMPEDTVLKKTIFYPALEALVGKQNGEGRGS